MDIRAFNQLLWTLKLFTLGTWPSVYATFTNLALENCNVSPEFLEAEVDEVRKLLRRVKKRGE
jgi:hypothetical protein